MKKFIWLCVIFAALVIALPVSGQKKQHDHVTVIETNVSGNGPPILLEVTAGRAHNHPMMAAWIEDTAGTFLQTLYVNKSVATGYFSYADSEAGKWKPGPLVRPASLPVWAHRRGIQSEEGHFMPTRENPVPDAYTSATPEGSFLLKTRPDEAPAGKLVIFFEINQAFDWNDYWTNARFPGDQDYKSSAQPSVVYSAVIDPAAKGKAYSLKAIGHGHFSGDNGNLYPDLTTLDTALEILKNITAKIE